MKFLALFFYFLSFKLLSFAQQTNSINLTELEVSEINPNKGDTSLLCGSSPFHFDFKGPLMKGIIYLTGKNESRVRFNKIVSDKYIKYSGFTSVNGVRPLLNEALIRTLENKFKFKITDLKDSIEIWALEIVDEKKIQIYSPKKDIDDRIGGPQNEPLDYMWESCGLYIYYLVQEIEVTSKHIVIMDKQDKRLYNFDIPFDVMKTYETLSEYLLKYYGIKVKKEKRLMDLVYVKFE